MHIHRPNIHQYSSVVIRPGHGHRLLSSQLYPAQITMRKFAFVLAGLLPIARVHAQQNDSYFQGLAQVLKGAKLTKLEDAITRVNSTAQGQALLGSLGNSPLTIFAPSDDACEPPPSAPSWQGERELLTLVLPKSQRRPPVFVDIARSLPRRVLLSRRPRQPTPVQRPHHRPHLPHRPQLRAARR